MAAYVPLSLRWASPACAAATAIRPAHVSQSVADGKRKKYWRVAQSRKSTVGSSVCTPTRCTVRKAMDVVFPRGVCEPGVPRYAVLTAEAGARSQYSTWGPGGRPPCASGTYPTREAGTRSLHVPNGGAGAYV